MGKARIHAKVDPHIGETLWNGCPQRFLAQGNQLLVDAPFLFRLLDGFLEIERSQFALAGGDGDAVHAEMWSAMQLVGNLIEHHVLPSCGKHAGDCFAEVTQLLPGILV